MRKYGDVQHNQALYHYHQAFAAEILSHKIRTYGQAGPDAELFEDVSLFFFSQIQASAYGAWKAHLSAAKTLFNLWGVKALMGNADYEFFLCHLVLADVFGTAMAPTAHISAHDIDQHQIYLELLGSFNVDVCSTMVPIPEDIVRAIAAINISRAETSVSGAVDAISQQSRASSDNVIFKSLQAFDPTNWALQCPRHTFSQATSWALLATCFQSAAVFYLIRTSVVNPIGATEEDINLFYTRLRNAIRNLYKLKQNGGVLYKYILWSMVISGIEAVLRNDEQHVRYLCDSLEQTTIDLGTLSMREASTFLKNLWDSNTKRTNDVPGYLKLDWDTVFAHAPLFLM